jgi:ABC-2 type transport system permease protein
VKSIYKRELTSYFTSMIGYLFIAAMIVFVGIYFMVYNLSFGYPYFAIILPNIVFILILAIPILTMRSMSDERRNKTDQMFMTYPVKTSSVILGKYFSMMTVVLAAIAICCICPIIIALNGNSYLLGDYIGIFAFFCLAGLFVSIGMFISSKTENQIISALLTFGVLLLIYWWDSLISFIPSSALGSFVGILVLAIIVGLIVHGVSRNKILAIAVALLMIIADVACYIISSSMFESLLPDLLSKFSCMTVLNNFTQYNVFDISGLFMYISFTALFIILTVLGVQKRRWC